MPPDIDYFEAEDFDRVVFTIEDGEIQACPLRVLCEEHALTTTTPSGIAPVMHRRNRALWTWGYGGQYPARVMAFESEIEAEHALLIAYRHELLYEDAGPTYYDRREEAEQVLRALQEKEDT